MAKQNSGHTPKWAGNGKLVANCPQCPNDPVNPSASAITVRPHQKTVVCKNGHIFVTSKYIWKKGFEN